MGFIFAPAKKAEASETPSGNHVSVKKRITTCFTSLCNGPVVYDFAINRMDVAALLGRRQRTHAFGVYYAMVVPEYCARCAEPDSLRRAELEVAPLPANPELRGMVQILFRSSFPHVKTDGAQKNKPWLRLLDQNGFDPALMSKFARPEEREDWAGAKSAAGEPFVTLRQAMYLMRLKPSPANSTRSAESTCEWRSGDGDTRGRSRQPLDARAGSVSAATHLQVAGCIALLSKSIWQKAAAPAKSPDPGAACDHTSYLTHAPTEHGPARA